MKYESDSLSKETYDSLQESRDKLNQLMSENVMSLDMVE